MRFHNQYDSSTHISLLKIIKWQLSKKRALKGESSLFLVQNDAHLLKTKEDFICWLGHASFLVQLAQKRFLFDPLFGNIPFYKRQTPAPYSVEELGRVDYVFISHVHYDHFDAPSLKALAKKSPTYIVPLGMERYIKKIDKDATIYTLDWYEDFKVSDYLKLSFVPSKHWGRRGVFDTNKALWGGAVLSLDQKAIYFAGDTAYDDHFKQIGKKYTIDYALLPVGAYEPVEVMKHNHINPQEAYNAYIDLEANIMIPMHYGTFKLADEPLNEPSEWIDRLIDKHGEDIYKIAIGEVKMI